MSTLPLLLLILLVFLEGGRDTVTVVTSSQPDPGTREHLHRVVNQFNTKGTVSVILRDSSSKDDNARFTTVLLQAQVVQA